ncbi:MAG: kynureninase [Firmicutes bacterium]|nr:kynureninase [Bacillota bacterium]
MQPTLAQAHQLDAADPLAGFRERFYIPEGVIYLDGNSLGLLSRDAEASLLRVLEEWKRLAVDGWTRAQPAWFETGERLGAAMAEVVGAEAEEVVVTGSTTVNLHHLVRTFYRPEGRRRVIVADRLNFPSDQYALEAIVAERGLDPAAVLRWVPSRDGRTIAEEDVEAALDEDVALLVLPSVYYVSGQLVDVARLTRAAHRVGALAGFDLCHSAGVLPHRLHEWEVDFAFWCTYKYLNAGPGATAALYVHRRHFGRRPALAGWWGVRKDRQFDMQSEFLPAPHAGAWQIGTVPMLSTAPLEGSLRLLREAGVDRVREKSLKQTEYLLALVDEHLGGCGFEIVTPREPQRRGGHVALAHPQAVRIAKALKAAGVVPDFRAPDVLRLAPSPLYTAYREIWEAVARLREIMMSEAWRGYPGERDAVA